MTMGPRNFMHNCRHDFVSRVEETLVDGSRRSERSLDSADGGL